MIGKNRLERLLEPTRIGIMNTRNRMVMPAMATCLKAEGRYGVNRHKAYYEARAKGGVGLIIVEFTSVDYTVGRAMDEQLRLDDDRFIPALRELAEAIKGHGVKAAIQLHHCGAVAKSSVTGVQPVAPSAITGPGYDVPKELTLGEIKDIENRFAKAAKRAREAGFDGVEIAAGHRYLIGQFLSCTWNKRQDDYGGSLENRAKFLLEVVRETRRVVGADYPLWCRLNGLEYGIKGGITTKGMQELAFMLQEAGANAIHIHASAFPSLVLYDDLVALPPYGSGSFADLAEAVKKVVRIPVIVAGRISPELGEKILRQQKADLVAMGRPLIADPELPNKVMSDRLDDIVPCVYCNRCMDPVLPRDCTVNAARGREREYALRPAKQSKKVVVVGGGPAGMEVARVAALRGHQVTLYEKDQRLGGQLILAGVLRDEYENLTRYLATQVRKLGVKVIVGKQVTPALVDCIAPDAVIVATGPAPVVPEIPGIGGDNVISAVDIQQGTSYPGKRGPWTNQQRWRRALWSLGITLLKKYRVGSSGKWPLGLLFGNRVVVMGGGLAGLEIADFLVGRNKKVTIVETGESVSGGPRPMFLLMQYLFHKLAAGNVGMLTKVTYEAITDKGLVVTGCDGEHRLIEADTIVLALGTRPDFRLASELKDKVREVYLAGDCVEPYGIGEAIASGSRIARMV